MTMTATDRTTIEDYRAWLEQQAAGDERLGPPQRVERDDGSQLATRFALTESVWAEAAVRPTAKQLLVSVLTDDRWKSEEMEQGIQDSGESMEEFVELGFDDAGLSWTEPPVLHYREAGKLFYFSTPLDLDSLSALGDPDVRQKSWQMLQGYAGAFGPLVRGKE